MSRLSDEMLALLLRNASHEMRNSVFYATLSNHLGVKGFTNASEFCKKQIEEEQSHFNRVWGFLQDRNAKAILNPIQDVSGDYSDLKFAFNEALKLEILTTELWQEVLDKSIEINDGITKRLAEKYMKIQKSEEDEFLAICDELTLIGDNIPMQKLWDNTYKF